MTTDRIPKTERDWFIFVQLQNSVNSLVLNELKTDKDLKLMERDLNGTICLVSVFVGQKTYENIHTEISQVNYMVNQCCFIILINNERNEHMFTNINQF